MGTGDLICGFDAELDDETELDFTTGSRLLEILDPGAGAKVKSVRAHELHSPRFQTRISLSKDHDECHV